MSNFYTYAKHYGNSILYRGIENGKRVSKKVPFSPTLFVPANKETPYKSMYGEPVAPMSFDNNKDATEFVEQYKEVSNFPIYGQTHWGYQFLADKYQDEIDWDISQVKVFSIDIETTVENGFPDVFNPKEQITLITLQDNVSKKITTFGLGPYTPTEATAHLDVDYSECTSEKQLLSRFIHWWANNTPDVITGWNCKLFDIPYIIARMERVFGDEHGDAAKKMMSPFRLVRKQERTYSGRTYLSYDVQGVAQLDYLDIYQKFTYVNRESYKLDHIAEVELGHKKLENPYDTFKEFYEKDWNRFVEYNIIDTVLVDQLEDKMKLIELCLTMTYDAKMNFEDVFSPVKTWDCLLYNHLLKQNIIIGQGNGRVARTIAGAYVQEPVPGAYQWVESFDATSLYPSIIMQYNMSPETLVPGGMIDVDVDGMLERKYTFDTDDAIAANGQTFTRSRQGHFPNIVQKFFDDRQRYKKLMIKAKQDYEKTKDPNTKKLIAKYNNFQMARKIQLNSLYGAMANEYFRYYDDRIAEGITLTGQFIIRETASALNEFLNETLKTTDEVYSFYTDTDSCYITLKALVDKFFADKPKDKLIDILDKVGEEQIEPCIDKAMTELADYTNAFEQKLVFKREAIADNCLWVAKKRYAMNVLDNEGVRYDTPDLKVMGLEIVRSSTPAPVRDSLREAVRICLTQDEKALHDYVEKTKKDFLAMTPEEIAFPRGCNNMSKYRDVGNLYSKGCPIHVRGGLLYNHYLKEFNVSGKYESIQEGDKIKFIFLKEPNIIRENVLGFISTIPKEFGIHSYIDYEMMFQKAFLEPLDTIVKTLGWHTEKQSTLEDLFV
jgi:DNA polymerase elongation subunit (family B)